MEAIGKCGEEIKTSSAVEESKARKDFKAGKATCNACVNCSRGKRTIAGKASHGTIQPGQILLCEVQHFKFNIVLHDFNPRELLFTPKETAEDGGVPRYGREGQC